VGEAGAEGAGPSRDQVRGQDPCTSAALNAAAVDDDDDDDDDDDTSSPSHPEDASPTQPRPHKRQRKMDEFFSESIRIESNPSRKRKSTATDNSIDEFAANKAPRGLNTTARPAHQGNNGNEENTREPREHKRDQETIRDVREQESTDEDRGKERRVGIG